MKFVFTIMLAFSFSLLLADIPRVDIIEVTWGEKTYFMEALASDLQFKEGCVFDYDKQYICEQDSFFVAFNNRSNGQLYSDLITIPKKKLGKNYYDYADQYYSSNIYYLAGTSITLIDSIIESPVFVDRLVGNPAGYITNPDLSKNDETWINDYDLEKVGKSNDRELCQMDFFSIKGNQNESFVQSQIVKMNDYLGRVMNDQKVDVKELETIHNDLLANHILMIGFCSC